MCRSGRYTFDRAEIILLDIGIVDNLVSDGWNEGQIRYVVSSLRINGPHNFGLWYRERTFQSPGGQIRLSTLGGGPRSWGRTIHGYNMRVDRMCGGVGGKRGQSGHLRGTCTSEAGGWLLSLIEQQLTRKPVTPVTFNTSFPIVCACKIEYTRLPCVIITAGTVVNCVACFLTRNYRETSHTFG